MKRRTTFWIIVCLVIFLTACIARQAGPDTTIVERATAAPAGTTLTPTDDEVANGIPQTDPDAGESEATETTTDGGAFALVEGVPTEEGTAVTGLAIEQSQQPLDLTQPHEIAVDATLPLGVPLQFPSWCAVDEATARANIEQIDYVVAVDGETHNLGDEFGWEFVDANTRYCAFIEAYLMFSDPGEHQVLFTIHMNTEVNDGWEVYQPGGRVYELNLDVQ